MEATLKIPLKEQENLKELFRLLEERGMQAEKGQVMDLADYIDSMDAQFEKVLSELQTVKRQLKVIEQRGIRQTLLRTVGTLEAKVGAAKAEPDRSEKSVCGRCEPDSHWIQEERRPCYLSDH